MADYKHGEMDTKVQEATFHGFTTMVRRAVIIVLCILIFMALVNA
jgi:hypothetical protein